MMQRIFGMQEVVVEGSPFTSYGPDFIFYQFFMGLGDAIPVVFLCLTLGFVFGIMHYWSKLDMV